jgi:hypothetical protein
MKTKLSITALTARSTIATFVVGASLCLSACAGLNKGDGQVRAGAKVQLVSTAEVEKFKGDATENVAIPLSGDEPAIEVVRPAIRDGKVASPVGIEVRFKPVAGKVIDPKTFKLYYGAFKIDVTDRLLKTAKVTATGFSIDNVDIPSGAHRLIMKVSDDAGTAGFKEIKFSVGG